MQTKRTWLFVGAFALAMAGCNSSIGGESSGPCAAADAPEECNVICSIDSECAGGFHCGNDGVCNAECTLAGGECGDGLVCTDSGRCQLDDEGPGCPNVSVQLSPQTPTVQLLIDQSGTMEENFPGSSDRWNAVRSSLVGQNGVVTALQDSVEFGATLYTSNRGRTEGQPCPLLQSTSPKKGSLADINQLFVDHDPFIDTPTAESVLAVANEFPQADGPRIIVLATDGLADTCDDYDAHNPATAAFVENTIQSVYQDKGIETYVLAVGPGLTDNHMQRMANAGQGLDLATGGAPFYVANNQADLTTAFDTIIRGARTCTFQTDGEVGRPAEGTVTLNGENLVYETDWILQDPTTLELLGSACDTFLQEDAVRLDAEFPCGSVIIVE